MSSRRTTARGTLLLFLALLTLAAGAGAAPPTKIVFHVLGTTTYADGGLEPKKQYSYRVHASNRTDGSGPSNTVRVSTTTLLRPPSGLTVKPASASALTLTWFDNSVGEAGVAVERSANGFEGWAEVGRAAGADVTTHQDRGLQPDTTYYYRVRAYDSDGYSYSSATAASTTEGE